MSSVLPSVLVLGLAAVAALNLAWSRPSPESYVAARRAAARALALVLCLQGLHFVEEALTGFHVELGAVLGLPGMPLPFFLAFNLAWLGIWVASVWGVSRGWAPAFFAAWFLAIAGMFNGIAHPLLAVAAGGYFPGLASSPVIGAGSVWLFVRLRGASRPRGETRAGMSVD